MSINLEEIRHEFESKNNIKYNNNGYYIKNKKPFYRNYKVTVITPVYNAEDFLEKTVNSVINQSFGFENIQYIMVDDGSTDSSREIMLKYGNLHKNIMIIFLKDNTGTPAQPRNIGVNFTKSKYVTFLDADDWLHGNGIRTLYNLIESTGDNYVVGKTIEVGNKGNKVIGEYESYKEQRNISPYSIPHIFHHLGPRARMMKTGFLKKNKIKFPEMKFAEDKQFFIDVLTKCKTISTTNKIIYFLNRLDDNDESLTKKTNIILKMESNLKVINYVKRKGLKEEIEKMILNRLYEFDSMTRLFDRYHFFKSDKKEKYYDIFNEVLETTKDLNYDFSDNFFHPINKVAYNLFLQSNYDDLINLYRWNKKEKRKQYIIKDNLPYMIVPVLENSQYNHVRVPMLTVLRGGVWFNDKYYIDLMVYGDYVQNINGLLFRNRKNITEEYVYAVDYKKSGIITVELDIDELKIFSKGKYAIYLRYNGYEKSSIVKVEQLQVDGKNFKFYTTVNSNLGLQIE